MGRFGLSFVPLSRPLNKINTDGKCLAFDLAKPNLQMSLPKETEGVESIFFFFLMGPVWTGIKILLLSVIFSSPFFLTNVCIPADKRLWVCHSLVWIWKGGEKSITFLQMKTCTAQLLGILTALYCDLKTPSIVGRIFWVFLCSLVCLIIN